MKKTVLITGASSGIGKRTALYFHERNWNVAATMRTPENEKELKKYSNISCFRLDVTDMESIRSAIQKIKERFGTIDVLVNNAAYSLTGAFEGATAEQINDLYNVDVFGVMNVTREVLPLFREKGKGVIVNVSSLGGLIGMPLSSFYASAKWAIEGFSESIRFELLKQGIKIKIIEPGAIKTAFASNAVIVRKDDVQSYSDTLNKRLRGYEQRRDRLNDPVIVSREIYRAATDTNDRLRYLAGNDAKTFWRIRKILPFSMFTKLLNRMAG